MEQPIDRREHDLDRREASVRLREIAVDAHELRLRDHEAAGIKDGLITQIREANERLVLETVRANEQADAATTSRDAYRTSEQQFRALADTIPMLAWYAGPTGEAQWYNQRWREYTGWHEHDVAPSGWQSVLDPVDLPRVMTRWHAALREGTPWEDQFRLRRADGELRWFLARALPIRDVEGRITRWLGTNTDIDEQKRAERLTDAGNRAKDEFLGLLGHELRNPLAPIRMALELMQIGWPQVAVQERGVIGRQVEHLVRLVDDLLDVSRITRGRVELRVERVEISAVVARAVELSSPLLEQRSQALTQSIATTGLAVDADASRLAQVIGNLVANAAKYTPPHGRIEIEARQLGAKVAVRVRDNGIGISAEMLPRVFEMFAQEHQGLDRPQGGLGLGLAIAKNLVELHGGSIRAHSEGLGHGSWFELELPIAVGAAESDAAERLPSRPTRADAAIATPRRVLIVDDNKDAADLTAQALALLGHDVRVAFDGPAALAMAAEFGPEVALLDIGLPGMNGYELAARLRELPSPHALRFIAVTGYGEEAARARSYAAGFDMHLVKPVGLPDLSDAIARLTADGRRGS